MLWICCNKSPIEWRWNIPYLNCSIDRTCCNIICVCICIKGRLFYSINIIRVSLKWINQRVISVYFYLTICITNDNFILNIRKIKIRIRWAQTKKTIQINAHTTRSYLFNHSTFTFNLLFIWHTRYSSVIQC